ncbi:hypothetical protein D5S17_32795 [Pseudonocardiaceae bacterium YIM PH 21723]|nr:hypothetical protein D5S17_32795 [Pseudonocardiaceae bacterium YIM PH 21723]
MPLVRGHYATSNPEWTLAGRPVGLNRQNMPRMACVNDSAALTSQIMFSTALHLDAGDAVAALSFQSGTVAASSPTNWWFALYDDSATPVLMAQTADQLTAAWAANTVKTLALATPQAIARTGIYYAAVMVKATTAPSLLGVATLSPASAGWLAGDKVLGQNSGSSLTTTAPATIASPSAAAFVPRVVAT